MRGEYKSNQERGACQRPRDASVEAGTAPLGVEPVAFSSALYKVSENTLGIGKRWLSQLHGVTEPGSRVPPPGSETAC